jgi:hypothetical protein
MLLDFLYSGQTFVPVDELEQLQDLLALLQIKPNIWRSGDSKKDIVNGKSSALSSSSSFIYNIWSSNKLFMTKTRTPLCKSYHET